MKQGESRHRSYPMQPMVTVLRERHPAEIAAITDVAARAGSGPAPAAPQATTIPARQGRGLGRWEAPPVKQHRRIFLLTRGHAASKHKTHIRLSIFPGPSDFLYSQKSVVSSCDLFAVWSSDDQHSFHARTHDGYFSRWLEGSLNTR